MNIFVSIKIYLINIDSVIKHVIQLCYVKHGFEFVCSRTGHQHQQVLTYKC